MIIKQLIFGFYFLVIAVLQSAHAEPTQITAIAETMLGKPTDYITFIQSNTLINFEPENCDQETLTYLPTNTRIIHKCKILENSVYLMNSQNKTISINEFVPTKTVDLGDRLGLLLFSDSNVADMLIGFDQNGNFEDYYLLDGEPLLDKTGTKLLSPNLVVWYSSTLSDSSICANDLIKSLGKSPKKFSFLYLHSPIQIKFINISRADSQVSKEPSTTEIEAVLVKLISGTISNVIPLVKTHPELSQDFKERLLVFLSANAPNKKILRNLVIKYKSYLRPEDINQYSATKSCS